MKLLDLHLLAYGPFSDRHLDLGGGSEGLHVVYGLNEAGKSSALRALRALLYGIPERTQDDFRHDKAKLRVGGLLRGADGAEFRCYRRKGHKKTLLDANGEPVAGEMLARLLGGVGERLFERLFGIDHEALVSGGQALLDERGREAEALFGSGLGSTVVHSLLKELEEEAKLLFKPRASNPLINAALSKLADIEKKQREVSLSARQWDEARKAVSSARGRLKEIDRQLTEAEKQRSLLERVRRTLPGLAKRVRIHEQLNALGRVPPLADDFGQRRREAELSRRTAAEGSSRAKARLKDLHDKAAGFDVSKELLAEADAIDALREQLGGYRKAARDRPGLISKRATLEDQARGQLAETRSDLKFEDIDTVRPLLASRRRATVLGGRQEALESAVKKGRDVLADVESKLTAKRDELDHLPPPVSYDELRQVVDAARRSGDLDGSLEAAESDFDRHSQSCGQELAALGLWRGNAEQLCMIPLPDEETVRRFEDAFQEAGDEKRRLEDALSEVRTEGDRAAESLRALQLAGAVPTEDELHQSRERRDDGWRLLRRQWIDGEDVTAAAQSYAQGKPLPEAFEEGIGIADETSDRLRRESQRVHEQATAQAKLEACQKRITESETALQRAADERESLEQSWQAVWSEAGISAFPPREMSVWIETVLRLREKIARGDELRDKVDALRRDRDRHLQNLTDALASCGEVKPEIGGPNRLSAVLRYAESRLRSLEKTERRRTALKENIEELGDSARQLDREAKSANTELASWRSEWAALMHGLALDEKSTPGEVSDYIQAIADMLKLIDEAKDLRERIRGVDMEAQTFESEANNLLTTLAPDLLDRSVGESALQLHARLGKQRETKSRLDELTKQAKNAEDEARDAEASIRAADDVLRELCQQAESESPEQLETIEKRYAEHQRLSERLQDVERELVEGGDGLSIDELEAETAAVDRDAVVAEIETFKQRIEKELHPQREILLERRVTAERDFEAMAGGADASVFAEEAQQTLSALRSDVDRYARFRLAARVLRDEIERFRRRHRDPILGRASGYFEKLTCRSLAKIETDFDETDQPVLVGVRPSGEQLRVEAMSSGTRDQLYLALRLATLDHYVENSEPLPFIVDDILIQFDDERARATLQALAEFSAKAQVILFTHHGQVADEAGTLENAASRVFVHELG